MMHYGGGKTIYQAKLTENSINFAPISVNNRKGGFLTPLCCYFSEIVYDMENMCLGFMYSERLSKMNLCPLLLFTLVVEFDHLSPKISRVVDKDLIKGIKVDSDNISVPPLVC
jgi:hypothetical protein